MLNVIVWTCMAAAVLMVLVVTAFLIRDLRRGNAEALRRE